MSNAVARRRRPAPATTPFYDRLHHLAGSWLYRLDLTHPGADGPATEAWELTSVDAAKAEAGAVLPPAGYQLDGLTLSVRLGRLMEVSGPPADLIWEPHPTATWWFGAPRLDGLSIVWAELAPGTPTPEVERVPTETETVAVAVEMFPQEIAL